MRLALYDRRPNMQQVLTRFVLLVLLSSGVAGGAQRSRTHDLPGTSVEAYELRPGFLLTVSRDGQGRPKQMVVEKVSIAGQPSSPDRFTRQLAGSFIDELAPVAKRGGMLPTGGGISCLGLCYETQDYDNVRVTQVCRDFDVTEERLRLVLDWHIGEPDNR